MPFVSSERGFPSQRNSNLEGRLHPWGLLPTDMVYQYRRRFRHGLRRLARDDGEGFQASTTSLPRHRHFRTRYQVGVGGRRRLPTNESSCRSAIDRRRGIEINGRREFSRSRCEPSLAFRSCEVFMRGVHARCSCEASSFCSRDVWHPLLAAAIAQRAPVMKSTVLG